MMCQRILKKKAGGSKKILEVKWDTFYVFWENSFWKRIFFGSLRWTSRKSLTNSQAATCHHLLVALESTHHFPVGASIRTHRAADIPKVGLTRGANPWSYRAQGGTWTQDLPKHPTRPLPVERNFFLDIKSYNNYVFFPPFFFHASFSGGACGEREIER